MLVSLFLCLASTLIKEVEPALVLRRKVIEGKTSLTRIQKEDAPRPPMAMLSKIELSADLLMVADYSLFRGFVDMAKGDEASAQVYVQDYLSAVFDQMKAIYDEIPIGNSSLKLNMIGTTVIIREEDCPMLNDIREDVVDEVLLLLNETESGNRTVLENSETNATEIKSSMKAVEALARMTEWVKEYYPYLPKHDHAVLVTKLDLLSAQGESSTQGMAYVGEICRIGQSSSVVEDIGAAATALIAAHELAHSLGSFHDGSHNTSFDCRSDDNYLMATTVSGSENDILFSNSRQMSNCSRRTIEESLKLPATLCLRKEKNDGTEVQQKSTAMLPGEKFPLQRQCQIIFGPHYGVCSNEDYFRGISVCRRVWCKNRLEKRSAPCETRTYLPAFDGTECGKNKWCINGKCVFNEKKLKNCKDINQKTCSKYTVVKLRHYCKSAAFREICCNSCARLKE